MNDLLTAPQHILIIDDDESLRQALTLNLRHVGYIVTPCSTASEARALFTSLFPTIIVCDLTLPDTVSTSFIFDIREAAPDAILIATSGAFERSLALECFAKGADDFLSKPFSIEDLLYTIQKNELRKHSHSGPPLDSKERGSHTFPNIIAESSSMKEILETVKRLSSFATTVLITGESGTGKELIARAIHDSSPRSTMPFIAINCGAIPENLMESELFGHKKGSFTDATRDKKGLFEEADGGTLFLDEIGELPLHLQVKLLRTLQEQKIRRVGDEVLLPINIRIIAATLRNLEEAIADGHFREDLFYRLNVVSIHIPPLRERVEDTAILIKSFIKKYNKKLGTTIDGIADDAKNILLGYPWKGNVRELENCIERAMVLAEGSRIECKDLPDTIRESVHTARSPYTSITQDGTLSIRHHAQELEIFLIQKALERTNGNRTHAAKVLEISHRALLYKIKEYGLGGRG